MARDSPFLAYRSKSVLDRVFEEGRELGAGEAQALVETELRVWYLEIKKLERTELAKAVAILKLESEIKKRAEYFELKAAVDDALGING